MGNDKSISIILIDDSELDLMIMYQAFKFTHVNYIITPFSSHTDAFDYLNQEAIRTPDVIIIDAKTLHVCRDSFLSYIKDNPKLKDIPVLVLTSIGGEEVCFSKLKLPSNCFIEKPFSLSDMPEFSGRIEDFWSTLDNFSTRLN